MPNLLHPAPTSIRQFSYDPRALHFTAEMSDTRGLGHVWDDSADEGLTIVGDTGRQVVFVVQEEHRDAEGEVTHWTLRSTTGGFTLTLFND